MAIETKNPPAAEPTIDPGYAAKLGGKIRKFKDERDAYKARAEAAETELNELKSKPADPTAVQLRAELRELKHRAVFDRIASELKARPDGLDDLWKLSGYIPDTDVADEAKIKELLDQQAKQRGYLFEDGAAATKPGATETKAEAKPPGPGNNRGGLVTQTNTFRVSRRDTRDAEWMRTNQKAFADALKAGNVEYVD